MADQLKTRETLMVDFVVKEFQRYEKHWGPAHEKAKTYFNDWSNKPPSRDFDWQNAVQVPVTVEAEQTISPRLFTALFPNDSPVDVVVEGNMKPQQGIKIKHLIKHYFKVSNVQGEWAKMLPQIVLYGTGYAEAGTWCVKKGWKIDKENIRYYASVESRPDFKFVDYFELFPHPAKLEMDDGLPLIRRRFVDSEYLKSMAENENFDFKNLKEALQTESVVKNERTDGDDKRGEDYEILDYWGPYDSQYEKDGKLMVKKMVPHWTIIINRKVCVRFIENPYNHQIPPFIRVKLFEDAKPNWMGVGIGQVGKPTQDRLNKIVNQRLDNVDLVLNKERVVNGNDTMINRNKLKVSKPGNIHYAQDINNIQWIDVPDVTSSAYQEEALAKQDYREATGATMQLMPTDSGDQHRTALGIQILQGAAGMRFRPVLRLMEIEGIQKTAMFFFSNLRQFMSEQEWILITGKFGQSEPILVTPEEIQAKVFFIPTGLSETMNKETQVQQLLRFKEVTAQDPTVNRAEINKRIAELFGFKEIEKILIPQEAATSDVLPADKRMAIKQRLAEGATPDQIKAELLGPRPSPASTGKGGPPR